MARATGSLNRLRLAACALTAYIPAGTCLALDCNTNGTEDDRETLPDRVHYEFLQGVPLKAAAVSGEARDFDADGHVDLAVLLSQGPSAAPSKDYIVLQWREPGGGFGARAELPAGKRPMALCSADLDGDGDFDLATANSGSADVTVLLNEGAQSFRRAADWPILDVGASLNAVDLDGDGDLELVTGSVSFLRGRGDGAFEPSWHFDLPRGKAYSLAAGDVDGDGDQDLVTTWSLQGELRYTNGFLFLSNDGKAVFEPQSLEISGDFQELTLRDVDRDGDVDAVTHRASGFPAFHVLRNVQREGSTRFIESPQGSGGGYSVLVEDLDADGRDEVVVTGIGPSLRLFEQDGGVTFADAGLGDRIQNGTYPHVLIASGDFDGRAGLELVVSGSDGYTTFLRASPFSRRDCDGDLIPDDCRRPATDCDQNAIPDLCDVLQLARTDCNGNLTPDDCDLKARTSFDCNRNGTLDECDVASGSSPDLTGNGIPDECDVDCNQNGVSDHGDLLAGRSADCNGNFVPDECDVTPRLAFGPARAVERSERALAPTLVDWDADGDLDAATAAFRSALLHRNDGNGVLELAGSAATGSGSVTLAAADLDRDGRLDIVAGNHLSLELPNANVTVLLRRGEWKVGVAKNYAVGRGAPSLVAEDLTGDAVPDVAVVNEFDRSLRLFQGAGDGSLLPPSAIALPNDPRTMVGGDLDGDGDIDLAVALRSGGLPPGPDGVHFLWNDGRGAFDGGTIVLRNYALEMEARDFDGDGRLDIALAQVYSSPQRPLILRQAGARSFDAIPGPILEAAPRALAAGDVDGDADADLFAWLATSPVSSGALLLNHGEGSFAARTGLRLAAPPRKALLADLDGDGSADLFGATEATPSRASTLFVAPQALLAASRDCNGNLVPDECEIKAGTVADCNGNGIADLCDDPSLDCNRNGVPDPCDLWAWTSADCNRNQVPDECEVASSAEADCNANGIPDECDLVPGVSFAGPAVLDAASRARNLEPVDLDGDGSLDVAALETGALVAYRNQGGGRFEPGRAFATDRTSARLAFADFDGDRRIDVAGVGSEARLRVSWGLSGSDLSPAETVTETAGDHAIGAIAAADFGGSGERAEIALLHGRRIKVFQTDGGRTFTLASEQELAACHPLAAATGDLHGDGDIDIVLAAYTEFCPFGVWIIANEGGFTWSLASAPAAIFGPTSIRLVDLNADGQLDVIVAGQLFLGRSSGPFVRGTAPPGTFNRSIEVLDIDSDGAQDVVVPTRHGIWAHLNDGLGGFRPQLAVRLGSVLREAVQGDFDGDGAGDLAGIEEPTALQDPSARIVFFRNETQPPIAADADANGKLDECEAGVRFHRGDASPDGRLDVTDAVVTLRFLFAGAGQPPCLEAADADNSGRVNLSDALEVLLHLFLGGAPPEPPGPPGQLGAPCGLDPDPSGSPGDLGCEAYEGC